MYGCSHFIRFRLKFNFFSDRRTLKFLKVKCNPVNKKTLALPSTESITRKYYKTLGLTDNL